VRFFNSDIMTTLDWSGKDADVAPSRWRPHQRGLKSLPVN